MEIIGTQEGIKIKQTQIIEKILFKSGMQNCKGISTPMEVDLIIDEKENILHNIPYGELVGSLMYLATISRPDIAYTTGVLSRYIHCPNPLY